MGEICGHGFPAADCLICETLGTGPARSTTAGPSRAATGGERTRTANRAQPRPDLDGGPTPVEIVRPAPSGEGRRRPIGRQLVMLVVALIVLVLVGWFLIGAVLAIARLIELIAVALVAGWVGYRLGHFRGRHQRP